MSDRFVPQRALVVGVDPHRENLDVIGICFPEEVVLDETFDNTRAGHERLWSHARGLAEEQGLSLVFGLEDGSNYGYALARYLLGQGCHVKEVNPRMTNRQRDFYGQDKTNRLDALATAAIVMRAHEQLPDLQAGEQATQATQELSRYREQLVREQTGDVNRLHSYLANQYPGYKSFFDEVNGVTALHFWAAYPTPSHLRPLAAQQLADSMYDWSHHRLSPATCLQKASHIFHLLDDCPVPEPDLLTQAQAAIICDLAQRLLQLKRSIEAIEAQLQHTLPATGQQLETFRGIGTVLAAVFVGETGDPARFHQDKDRFASYNGSAPATRGTGQHSRQVQNRWCNRRLKSALEQVAFTAYRQDSLSAAYYQACLNRGLAPREARKRLMRRLSDVIFALMRDKAPYDLQVHRRKQEEKRERKAWQPPSPAAKPCAIPSLR
jgi:transposase